MGRYPVGAVPSNRNVLGSQVKFVGGPDPRNVWTFNPAFITMNASSTVQNSLLNDRRLNEDVYAGYLQGALKLGQLTAQGGARYERTDLSGRYGVRNRAVTDVLAQFNGRGRASARYEDVFPSLHLRYALSDVLLARASVSTTIGRPPLDTVTASGDINLSSRAITVANPDLQPQRSTNYDASLEYYFKPVGVLSVGVFEKDIRDYISSVSTLISEAAAADLGAPLTNPSASAMTWTLSTDENGGKARVRVNYHATFQDGFNATNPGLRNSFRSERYQWDFNARCKITRKLSVFANLSNFTSEGEPDYNGWVAPERRDQTIGYSFIITGGVSASF